ncbi:MAG TPA: SelB C-terminal domain-containing protein, partial [Burkholderiaceae bacterium]|nr:SelB C-terminal domain-containing protein [Burkholderiaceae bacterium]
KCDLVDAARIEAVSAELRTLLAGTTLSGAAVIAVSSLSSVGVDALQRHLLQAHAARPPPRTQGRFRLAVDRCFTLAGFGTVVTGTAAAGQVAVGDHLVVSPRGWPVRVRSIHAHHRGTSQGLAGQRVALNLVGVDKCDVQRGDWIVDEAVHAPTDRLDVRLSLLAGEVNPLAHWSSVRLHLGAFDVGARVIPLKGSLIAPGTSSLVQLELDRQIGALRGDRFIVRDPSAQRTLGGGVVIDPFAPVRGRRKPQRLEVLVALEVSTPAAALQRLLALDQPDGVDWHRFKIAWNLSDDEADQLTQQVSYRALGRGAAQHLFAEAQLERLRERVRAALGGHHAKAPDSPGLSLEQLRRSLSAKPQPDVFALLTTELAGSGLLTRSGPYLRLAGHEPALMPAEQKLWERVRPWLDEAGLKPPRLADLVARDRQLKHDQVLRLMRRLAQMGKVYAVGHDYFVLPEHMGALAARAQSLCECDPAHRLSVKMLRESTGMSRHLSLPLIEFFDHIGFTKRSKDGRHVRRDARAVFGTDAG